MAWLMALPISDNCKLLLNNAKHAEACKASEFRNIQHHWNHVNVKPLHPMVCCSPWGTGRSGLAPYNACRKSPEDLLAAGDEGYGGALAAYPPSS